MNGCQYFEMLIKNGRHATVPQIGSQQADDTLKSKENSTLKVAGSSREITAGYMLKKSAKTNGWKKRWFLLNEKVEKLAYTKKEEEKQFCGIIVLEVALLLQMGREVRPPYIVLKIVSAHDRKVLAKVAFDAPPHGLSLISIKYDEKFLEPSENSPPISFERTRQSRRCKLPF